MEIIKPKKLKQGDTIGVIAPSSYTPPEDIDALQQTLVREGYDVRVHPQCYVRDYASAGSVEQKVAALHDMFADRDVAAVMCLRGGYQALHMLDKIDYDLLRANPKILTGFSDITALHGAFLQRAGLVTFHGINARAFRHLDDKDKPAESAAARAMLEMLAGDVPQNLFRDHPVRVLRGGVATGRVFGGNLQLLAALVEAGDLYHPAFDGAILVIEDLMEEITKLDRQLGAWRLRGVFRRIAGLVVGYMTDIRDTPGVAGPFTYTIEDVIRRHTAELQGPLVIHAPFGHEDPNYPFPQGVMAELHAESDEPRLSLLESPFA